MEPAPRVCLELLKLAKRDLRDSGAGELDIHNALTGALSASGAQKGVPAELERISGGDAALVQRCLRLPPVPQVRRTVASKASPLPCCSMG
jgi:hypothetical protein